MNAKYAILLTPSARRNIADFFESQCVEYSAVNAAEWRDSICDKLEWLEFHADKFCGGKVPDESGFVEGSYMWGPLPHVLRIVYAMKGTTVWVLNVRYFIMGSSRFI